MNLTRVAVLAGAFALVFGCYSAQAGDLFGKRSASSKDLGFRPTLGGSAKWYGRLDGAVAMHTDPDLREGGVSLTGASYDATWSVGIGVGR